MQEGDCTQYDKDVMITKYAPEFPVLLSEVQSGVLTLDLYLLGLISAFTAVRGYESVCCFVLLEPTPEEYRVPRVAPGATASKLFPPLLPSLAEPGPPLPYRPLQKFRYRAFKASKAFVCHRCGEAEQAPRGCPGGTQVNQIRRGIRGKVWHAAVAIRP